MAVKDATLLQTMKSYLLDMYIITTVYTVYIINYIYSVQVGQGERLVLASQRPLQGKSPTSVLAGKYRQLFAPSDFHHSLRILQRLAPF